MSVEDGEVDVYFGTYESLGNPAYMPWKLRHCNIEVSLVGNENPIGIPHFPGRAAIVFDLSGPTRQFKISGIRLSSEEDFSNYDFVHTQFNYITRNVGLPSQRNETYIGIEWLLSSLQAGLKGFILRIKPPAPYPADSRFLYGDFNVGLIDIDMSIGEGYNTLNYTLTLIERNTYETKNYPDRKMYEMWPREYDASAWPPLPLTGVSP